MPDRVQAAIDVRLQRDVNASGDAEVHFQFRNRYGQKVTIGYVVQGEGADRSARRIEGLVSLDPGEQKLGRDTLRIQTTPFTTLTGVAFSRITFAGTAPRPTAAGERCESSLTKELQRQYDDALAQVKDAETEKFKAEDLLIRVQRSQEQAAPLILSEGQPVKAYMASDDVCKAQMGVEHAKSTEEALIRVADALKLRLDAALQTDEAATAARREVAKRLAPTKAWADSGDWQKVEIALQGALSNPGVTIPDSDRAVLFLNLGLARMHLSRPSEALAAFNAACRLDPLNAACRCAMGVALLSAGRIDAAAEAFAEAVRLSPNEASYQFNLGVARVQQNRKTDAATAFREAVRLDPSNATYRARWKEAAGEK